MHQSKRRAFCWKLHGYPCKCPNHNRSKNQSGGYRSEPKATAAVRAMVHGAASLIALHPMSANIVTTSVGPLRFFAKMRSSELRTASSMD